MPETTPLAAWESFYVIMGSSAAVLTGLVFITATLMADDQPRGSTEEAESGIAAFGTPTIVHLCAVLLASVILSAPWHELSNAGVVLGLTALGGMAYTIIAGRRLRRQNSYQPVFEDWLWHMAFPLVAYVTLIIFAIALPHSPRRVLFGVGTMLVALLFIGLHNAWDSVMYIAVHRMQGRGERQE